MADAPTSSPVDLRGLPDGSPARSRPTTPPSLEPRPPRRRRRARRLGRAARPGAVTVTAPTAVGCGPGWPGSVRSGTARTRCSSRCSAWSAQTHPKADLRILEQAYDVAERHHRDQRRKSGDPYITHPLAVTTILAELGMTPPTLCAALLHDTVEDTRVHARPAARGLRRRGRAPGRRRHEARPGRLRRVGRRPRPSARWSWRWPATSGCSSSSWPTGCTTCARCKYVKPASAERMARETLEIYAPLAHRLGMNTLKWELEDLAFATLYPKVLRRDRPAGQPTGRPAATTTWSGVIDQLGRRPQGREDPKATVTGRPKHYYSIYQKMIVRGRDFADIYDLVGIRILVDSVRDCYAVLGSIHARWNPVPGRFKDYIAMPKFNMYQSLHTTVIGPEGKPVELQIRTFAMHRRAEYGVAAHWKYKEDPAAARPRPAPRRQGRDDPVRQRHGLAAPAAGLAEGDRGPGRVPGEPAVRPQAAEVYVFTPKGDVIALPAGATPVDFAYAVHTEVGHRCIGARVNGRLVPLESTLENGDIVEVFTSKAQGAGPSRDWLTFVQSPRARNKIRPGSPRSVARRRSSRARRPSPRRCASRTCRSSACSPPRPSPRSPTSCATPTSPRSTPRSATATSRRSPSSTGWSSRWAARRAPPRTSPRSSRPASRDRRRSATDPGVVVKGATDIWVKLARCCTPVPGRRHRRAS